MQNNTSGVAARHRKPVHNTRRAWRIVLCATAVAIASGCTYIPQQRVAPGEVPILLGPSVRDNVTPMEGVLACFADHVAASARAPIVVSVGDVKDYTGKYSINEGNAITQGGALMVYSALGKLAGAVGVAERFDPVIAERELGYADRRQLGDGMTHRLGNNGTAQVVPWMPYFGGSIHKSDYYIVGGITELNYNINSAGFDIAKNQVGPRARTFTAAVGVDLRIVDTRSLVVRRTVSLTKQFHGYEVGLNVFRFFDSDLFDVDIGSKGQEPMQLGIRTALEEGVVRLLGTVTQVDPEPCLTLRPGSGAPLPTAVAEKLRTVPNPEQKAAMAPAAASGQAVNLARGAGAGAGSDASPNASQITFDIGSSTLGGAAMSTLDQIAALARKQDVDVTLAARDTENWDARKRDGLIDERIAATVGALASRGIAPGAIGVSWRPDPADTSIHRGESGLQIVARLRVAGGAEAPRVERPQRKEQDNK
ncbi:MAG: hypothetical protein DI563_03080 [Variovorax paradoxus]|uniref:Curli production assembly/transport component CsgG n=1 Tax=Variovorax paradoxus TaxID=34073 RepID=A0A2W5SDF0_VARPD|nr:MAG: hypothetical protein DI563_03080 [Variovorax paradoxus]